MKSKAAVAARVAAYMLLVAVCAVSLLGARRLFRGVPLGSVLDVDSRTGAVKVDLGENDGVLKGMKFAVVDDRGNQTAVITPADLYDDMFWSVPPAGGGANDMRPGMQVRWVFTPELSMLMDARRKNTPEAYRGFAKRYPKSVYLGQLAKKWPDDMLRRVDPAYFDAWKVYTLPAFEDYIAKNPDGAFVGAAEAEIKSLKAYDAQREAERKEREKRAERYQEEMKRQQELQDRVLALQRQRNATEMHGKLVNNSSDPVRFVFSPPSMMPPTIVKPGEEFEISHPEGTYSYKVFAVPTGDEAAAAQQDNTEPQPLAEGTVDIQFDFWTVTYP